MRETYLDKFYTWMIREGRLYKEGLPHFGLSPRTAKNRVSKTRRILVDLGFIKVIKLGYRKYKYDFHRGQWPGDIRQLTVEMNYPGTMI